MPSLISNNLHRPNSPIAEVGLGLGCPAGKIAFGVPFYGRSRNRDARAYRNLIDPNQFLPTQDERDGFASNGRDTILEKARYAAEKNLAGMMIWELGQDTGDADTSLLRAIGESAIGWERRSAASPASGARP